MESVGPLSPIDVLRCILLGAPGKVNRAFALGNLGQQPPSWFPLIDAPKVWLRLQRKGCTWVSRQGHRVVCVAAARQRSGPQSWELTHLFLLPGVHGQLPQLLEKVSRTAASNGAKRVFVRLRRGDPLVDVARLSGFFPRIPEVLYRGTPRPGDRGRGTALDLGSARLREKRDRDEYSVFRLFNTATPVEVREFLGMTFDQWLSSREWGAARRREYVVEEEGIATGWLTTFRRASTGYLEIVVHPDHGSNLASMINFGLRSLRGVNAVYCVAPEYQTELPRVLSYLGFSAVGEYVTAVKSMATTAMEDAHAVAKEASA